MSTPQQPHDDNPDTTTLNQRGPDARRKVEDRCARPLTDEEWTEAKTNLVGFARVLLDWQKEASRDPG